MTAARPSTALPTASVFCALLFGAACEADPCSAICPDATERFEECLSEWGLSWGPAAGFEDRGDHLNWCQTWAEEERQLARTSSDPRAAGALLDARCADLAAELPGAPCADYWATFDP